MMPNVRFRESDDSGRRGGSLTTPGKTWFSLALGLVVGVGGVRTIMAGDTDGGVVRPVVGAVVGIEVGVVVGGSVQSSSKATIVKLGKSGRKASKSTSGGKACCNKLSMSSFPGRSDEESVKYTTGSMVTRALAFWKRTPKFPNIPT